MTVLSRSIWARRSCALRRLDRGLEARTADHDGAHILRSDRAARLGLTNRGLAGEQRRERLIALACRNQSRPATRASRAAHVGLRALELSLFAVAMAASWLSVAVSRDDLCLGGVLECGFLSRHVRLRLCDACFVDAIVDRGEDLPGLHLGEILNRDLRHVAVHLRADER